MISKQIYLPRRIHREVSFEELEPVLFDVAANMGWTGETADVYTTHYQSRGIEVAKPFGEPRNFLDHTEIRLRGNYLPKMVIRTHRDFSQMFLEVFTGLPLTASRRKVDQYWDGVFKMLLKEPANIHLAS